jgi:hypothetical protein
MAAVYIYSCIIDGRAVCKRLRKMYIVGIFYRQRAKRLKNRYTSRSSKFLLVALGMKER